jgi:uncharacterized protein YjbI with pentapeptide repeats
MVTSPQPPRGDRSRTLTADCGNCAGLCCVALAFSKSADFAFDKDAGEPCVNLDDDFRCQIHPHLRDRGFKGCTVFDCFGAGQKVTQQTFAGRTWRQAPASADQIFAVFAVVRQLHEILWYLDESLTLPQAQPLRVELEAAYDEIERLTDLTPADLLAIDLPNHRDRVNVLLARVSALVRADSPPRGPVSGAEQAIRPGADLIGARLAGHDLRGANIRGAYLIGADLRRADLRGADLLGADLRDADLGGADLSQALFLSRPQIDAARGDAETALPHALRRPSHWAT